MNVNPTITPRLVYLLMDLGIAYNGSCLTFVRDWQEMPVWVPDRSNTRANRAWFFSRCREWQPS